ncbi:MAG: hypothetical protein ACLUOG_03405 [Peptoniphilus lacrimalis]
MKTNIGIFDKNLDTVKNISYDSGNNEFMVNCREQIINFDKVTNSYLESINHGIDSISSCDGLVFTDDLWIFIEFKNGKISNTGKHYKVKKKVPHSLNIFCDILGINISTTREKMIFILVYNKDKNKISDSECQNNSNSKDFIIGHVFDKAKEEFVRFDLLKYKGVYFKEVHTFNVDEFCEYFDNNIKPFI